MAHKQPVAKVAIIGGAYLLLTRRLKPEKVYLEIDWPLLVMFVGLFVVISGLEKEESRWMLVSRSAVSTSATRQLWPVLRQFWPTLSATFQLYFYSSHLFRIYKTRNALGLWSRWHRP